MLFFHFRPARQDDELPILRLAKSAGLSVDPARERALPHSMLWIAESERSAGAAKGRPPELAREPGLEAAGPQVVAFCLAWCLADELELLDIAVDETCRRRGLGRRLLERVFHEAHERGCVRAFLEVREGNLPALALYGSLGFEQSGRRRRYYADGEDALLLSSCLPLASGRTLST